MIFVALGSQKFQFNRLLKAIDKLIVEGQIEEDVFAQVGYSDYQPQHFQYVNFLDNTEFAQKITECRIVIAHAGTGIIINAVKNGKKVLVVPRQKRYQEHVDNHQEQIAKMFEELGFICVCRDCAQLGEKLREAEKLAYRPYVSNTQRIIDSIDDFIKNGRTVQQHSVYMNKSEKGEDTNNP